MKIKLTIKRQTFENNLFEMEYNYKITQYDDFINSLQRILKRDVSRAMTNTTEFDNIFGKDIVDIPLLIIRENFIFTWINSGYLSYLIENGELDLFFTEKKEKFFNKDIQVRSYRQHLLSKVETSNHLKKKFKKVFESFSKGQEAYKNKRITSCLAFNKIDLSEEEKREIEKDLDIKIRIVSINEDKNILSSLSIINKRINFLEDDWSEEELSSAIFKFSPNINFKNNDDFTKFEIILNLTKKEKTDISKLYIEFKILSSSDNLGVDIAKKEILKFINKENNSLEYLKISDTIDYNKLSFTLKLGRFENIVTFRELNEYLVAKRKVRDAQRRAASVSTHQKEDNQD